MEFFLQWQIVEDGLQLIGVFILSAGKNRFTFWDLERASHHVFTLDGSFSQVEIDVITSSLIDVYTVVDEPVKYLKIIFNF